MNKNDEMLDYFNKHGGGIWCIGNGQLHDALVPTYEVSKTLNCMDDVMKILIVREVEDE